MTSAAKQTSTAKTSSKFKPTQAPHLYLVRKPLPRHEHASDHRVLLAAKKFGTKGIAKRRQLRASGEVACDRIREFAWDLGMEQDWAYGWKARAAARLGLPYATMWNIISHAVTTVSTKTVDHVAFVSGVPVREFYDNED